MKSNDISLLPKTLQVLENLSLKSTYSVPITIIIFIISDYFTVYKPSVYIQM